MWAPLVCWPRYAGSTLVAGALALASLSSCSVGRTPQLDAGYYQLVRASDSLLTRAVPSGRRSPLYIEQPTPDTLLLYSKAALGVAPVRYGLRARYRVLLLHRECDFDIFTLPFNVRPGREGVPVQLNTTFNAALYVGRRLDGYHLIRHRLPTGRTTPLIRTVGLGYGLFTGLGSSFITADLTRQHAQVEYESFVAHGGAAAIYDAHVFNVGVAIGVDHLLGPDAAYWLYQRKPWFGLLFGLNLS